LVEILRILLGRFLVRRKYGSQVRDQGEVNSDESAEKGTLEAAPVETHFYRDGKVQILTKKIVYFIYENRET
jgi:hypothetical protein